MVSLSLGQVKRTAPELTPSLQSITSRQWENLELSGFNVLESPLQGRYSMEQGLKPMRRKPRARDHNHYATARRKNNF
ncbi:hypothetical protein TNCV_658431 [Trichonephila clavipes]|uniref:Uncharacterized protein n=1 Tax=Trichonephila clavipes TaxID=2585209 RepID=A0A8X6SU33_TRICX|nr:hypothetical protein TNCV_658431 [Trichonephila clavipes]